MGNCFRKPKKSSAEIAPFDYYSRGSPPVKLYGSPSGAVTSYIRVALHYKAVSLHFIPFESTTLGAADKPVLQCGSDTISGSAETLLQYIEAKFPHPPLLHRVCSLQRERYPAIVLATTLQHKSMTWHLQRLVRWAEDMATRGARRTVDPSMGSPRMEVRKFGRSYSQLLEVMLEHAQMEERIIFPILEKADRGLSKAANEEHARDLPIMNGIKEEIKSIGVLEAGSAPYQEALFDLSARLKTLQEHCKQHFEEEERELLPLLEAVELSKEWEQSMVEQCMEVMEGTHSHLFQFLIEGLLPRDSMQYLEMTMRCRDKGRVATILCTLASRIEAGSMSTPEDHAPT
ncbi:PREDICTED: uncharacterized protein LOC104588984 isoform X2 [Nelumbo nucifera]|nr:PREDICTED: uncharacterized protein LOC104588984 isoform X2 [Nelumbo nucifera]XP_010245457.1 PREDICTED: uncharacterized protein LOC104588984 isoform X2 [Nelumbo nucifera]